MKETRKILALDIETKPTTAYVWGLHKVNISPSQIAESGGMICVGAQWVGKKESFFFSEWDDGHVGMLEGIREMLLEADAVLTFNGDSFDLPRMNGEFLRYGLPPVPAPTSIDVYKTIRKMGFVSGKLAYVGPLLGLGAKKETGGFGLWKAVMEGSAAAQKKMQKYCVQDVRLLIKLYEKVRPFIRTHPHLGDSKHECGACGSNNTQSRGFRRTKVFRIQRIQCQSCGSWSDGKREKVT